VASFHLRHQQRTGLVPLGSPALLRRAVLGVGPPLREGVGTQGGAVTDLDRSLMAAFERLIHGVSEITDGTVTGVNI
jgi:hypothetical protein